MSKNMLFYIYKISNENYESVSLTTSKVILVSIIHLSSISIITNNNVEVFWILRT